jgi:hypothetical protein
VNSNRIYSQTWVGQESFIYNAGLCQTIKEKCPYVYTCYDNASRGSPDVYGVYVDLAEHQSGVIPEMNVTIPIKINLHQILLLTSVRYLPSFCGRWELELYPNWNNLVVLPVHPKTIGNTQDFLTMEVAVEAPPSPPVESGSGTSGSGTSGAPTVSSASIDVQPRPGRSVSQDFTQIGEPFTMYDSFDGETSHLLEGVRLSCAEGTMSKCLMNLTSFQLRYEVFEGLRQMYAEQPFIIPTNVLQYARFSGQPSALTGGFHATLSQCLENCDSAFLLVPFNNNQTTCFYQPALDSVRLSLGKFGIHPANYVRTFDDPRFIAMALDSLNLETSEITAMNKDVARALSSPRPWRRFKRDATTGELLMVDRYVWDDGDRSNFFIGISLSQVGFQSGTISSPNTNIPFIFDANLSDALSTYIDNPYAGRQIETSIVAIFLLDCALMIQVVPNSDIPVVELTSKSIV